MASDPTSTHSLPPALPPALPWNARILTLFPAMFPGPLGQSLAGKALEKGLWSLDVHDIRDHAYDRHRTVDDTPFGGVPGMVMRPDVVAAAITVAASGMAEGTALIYFSPRGRRLDQALVRELAAGPGAVMVCGRYEGLIVRLLQQVEPVLPESQGSPLRHASKACPALARRTPDLHAAHNQACAPLPAGHPADPDWCHSSSPAGYGAYDLEGGLPVKIKLLLMAPAATALTMATATTAVLARRLLA